jgi:hypothetical protein
MKNQVNTIDIQAKEWFDKVNGNSYFAGLVTVNYGMEDAKEFIMPFQYGSGSQYEQEAFKVLKEANLINITYTSELRELGVIVRSSIVRNCKQRELRAYK